MIDEERRLGDWLSSWAHKDAHAVCAPGLTPRLGLSSWLDPGSVPHKSFQIRPPSHNGEGGARFCQSRGEGELFLIWSGSNVAQPGRDAVEHDGGDDGTAESSFAGPLVDTLTTAPVGEMDVDDRGEPK